MKNMRSQISPLPQASNIAIPSMQVNQLQGKFEQSSVFTNPVGSWKDKFLVQQQPQLEEDQATDSKEQPSIVQNFLLILCQSENNFIIKTTQSLLPGCTLPNLFATSQMTQHSLAAKVNELNYPSIDKPCQLLESSLHWCQTDPWRETVKQIESELVTDDLAALKKRFGSQLRFKENSNGIILAKKGAGWNYLNFVTV